MEHGGDFDLIPYSLPKSDKYITWSHLAKKRLLENNDTNFSKALESKRILIGQSPFHSIEKISRRKSEQMINVLFLATTNYFEIGPSFYYLKKLFKTLGRTKLNIEFLVKPHPFQNTFNFRVLFEKFKLQGKFVNNISLKKAVDMSDVVIFENTTAAFDALLAGKPTIFFNPYTGQDFFKLDSKNISLCILSGGDIEKKLISFLEKKKLWKRYAERGHRFAIKYLGLDTPYNKNAQIIKNLLTR